MTPRGPATSSLLINEPPLQALPSLACLVGLDGAVILQQIHYWLQGSDHEADGFIWVYNSYLQWSTQFRWLNPEAVRKQIRALESAGFLVSGRFGKKKMDRTKWYRIDYDRLNSALEQIRGAENLPDDTEKFPHDTEDIPDGTGNSSACDQAQNSLKKTDTNRIHNKLSTREDEQKKKTPSLSNVPIFAELQKTLGFPDKTDKDPIPNYGKEAKFIERMKKRGYSEEEILAYWRERIKSAGCYVEAWKINEDIGKPTVFRPRQVSLLPTESDLEAQARSKGVKV
jgi:hypothetical protein